MVEKCWEDGRSRKGLLSVERVVLNVPEANEELVLQQYGEDEEDNTFSCHRKQVLPYKVPLKRVQSLLCAWRKKNHKQSHSLYTNIFIYL